MLRRLRVQGFKSLADITVEFPRLTVLFGPNAAGKSNLLDAIQALSRVGTEPTLADALADPIRGRQIETFSFPSGGLQELLSLAKASFELEADLRVGVVTLLPFYTAFVPSMERTSPPRHARFVRSYQASRN